MHEGHRQRMYDTYVKQGDSAFHQHQLLEMMLSFSIPRCDTNPAAHALLETFGSLKSVLQADVHELMRIEGIGERSAILISLAGSLMRRAQEEESTSTRIKTPAAAAAFCKKLFEAQRYEAMYIISLDKKLKVTYCEKISSGTLTETTVYPRLAVESALRHGANSVLLTHNHPSGDLTPSTNDVDTTLLILKALEPIGIKLHDHIIVGQNEAFSMTRNSIIDSGFVEEPVAKAAESDRA